MTDNKTSNYDAAHPVRQARVDSAIKLQEQYNGSEISPEALNILREKYVSLPPEKLYDIITHGKALVTEQALERYRAAHAR